ncbi:MAG: hypothetical protein N0C84_00540 [Candidatus Thiodiazotropha taylori]|uniref:TNase-like domain-containing protein n=1 Tax=Candidatus Thiodiazotropha taylori TaxID=2792791 RepID=A0A9E4N2I6_9GAMM|nr:hypothetical protein [Candidatus Thiodiazotropha taylori]MCW4254932.1 hypothetical protein [Candidatus Thiodiazotropha taylori]
MIDIIIGGIMYSATLLNCYDGDTCKIHVEEFIPFQEYSLRMKGYDTPEIKGKCEYEIDLAYEAKEEIILYLQDLEEPVFISDKLDKYGRMIADVPGLADHMIDESLARPYDKGARRSWCDDVD